MTLSEIVLGYRLIAALGIRGLHQVQRHRVDSHTGNGFDAELSAQVLPVRCHGMHADAELLAYLLSRLTTHQEL